ncbi:Putative glycoside hydrolase, family 29, glycoside hydrolase superfamily [Septoria linicola]|uniref:Glycoside hydrolase, family 29, glycoside hydrolase superfamily n=1 Tax=Septoria linicola TaxID=215465 RepID=A0A9Q9EII5_9PEZI|nr:Putative glycoside hydrolase, family 29, glycoside hydrolase superfamily [Septoria linicola]
MQMTKKAFAASPGDADFDGIHSGYPAKYLPEAGLTYAGVDFDFPQYRETGNDNVLAMGQTIMPPAGRYSSIHLLAAAETAIATGNITTTYTDNTTTTAPVLVDPFWAWPYPYDGDLIFPYYLTNSSVDYNRSTIFQTISWVDSTKEISSIKLPNVTAGSSSSPGGAVQDTRLHIFAMSLVPATGSGLALEVQHARSTNSWMEGTNKTQIFSVKVNNVGDDWIMANNSVKVTIEASGIETVVPGIINRLRPGGQAAVQVGVTNSEGTVPGTIGEATVRIIGQGVNTSSTFNATLGIPAYDATYESIYSHESPSWYNNGKFGIFIHWGVYSVPGWGNI